ncbi:hypothetical protein BST61_g2522 [Cercospora zeina]
MYERWSLSRGGNVLVGVMAVLCVFRSVSKLGKSFQTPLHCDTHPSTDEVAVTARQAYAVLDAVSCSQRQQRLGLQPPKDPTLLRTPSARATTAASGYTPIGGHAEDNVCIDFDWGYWRDRG